MFCPNCRYDCKDSNFCPNCGTQIKEIVPPLNAEQEQTIPPLSEPYVQKINGKTVDLHKIIRMYGTGVRKIGAYSLLQSSYGLTKQQAKEILDPLYLAHAEEKVSFLDGIKAQAAHQKEVEQQKKEWASSSEYVGICCNCGDRLLAAAKRCPTCGKKDIVLVEKEDVQKIQKLREKVPNPKENLEAKWKTSAVLQGVTQNVQKSTSKANIKQRIQENKENGIACCPKCGSTSITAQKRGFGFVKGAIGASVGIDVGLIAGGLGSNKVILTCMNCGHQWKPSKK